MRWTEVFQNISSLNLNQENKDIIYNLVSEAYEIRDIGSHEINTRKRKVVETNAILVEVISNNFRNLTLKSIGSIFGKHHSSVIHYRKIYEDTLCFELENSKLYHKLHTKCYALMYSFSTETIQGLLSNDLGSLKQVIKDLSIENKSLKNKLESVKLMVSA
mgnify:CR=1 FL=1|tara:strand:- start:1506 stop:1988 length:483 start_codon:yes stop_codon:yes gene_type:complete